MIVHCAADALLKASYVDPPGNGKSRQRTNVALAFRVLRFDQDSLVITSSVVVRRTLIVRTTVHINEFVKIGEILG